MKAQKELFQARRDLLTQLLQANGYTATLETLTGASFKNGEVCTMANDTISRNLLPYLAMVQVEMEFLRRAQYVSIDGAPPMRKKAPAKDPEQDLIELLAKVLQANK